MLAPALDHLGRPAQIYVHAPIQRAGDKMIGDVASQRTYVHRPHALILGLLMIFDVPATPVEIVKVGHSALRNGTRNVPQELFGTPVLHELIEVMRVTLAGNGVGLAAPQIAVPLRIFVVEDTQDRMSHLTPEQQKARNRYPFPFEAVINPIWYATSPEMVIETEGCLSIPGFKADVRRYWAIEVEGFQPNGRRKIWSLKGWPARIFQHEIDHLDGRLLTDCMLPGTLTSTEPHGTGASTDLLQRLAISTEPPKEK